MPLNAPYRLPILALGCATAMLSCSGGARDAADPVARAQSHLTSGDAASATAVLETGGARDAVDPAAACLLGRLYRERGTIQGRLLSQGVLETARARHPDDLDVVLELAKTNFAQGFYPDAVRALRKVLAQDPARCD
ncbi:MAG TPA: tetratricopeptide repeat protein, partial [Candidatus Krumholzibacteria bacterium]|nr:tetratricopeptide repeat protein [Candidatus Krumholzibacteria bacterium]